MNDLKDEKEILLDIANKDRTKKAVKASKRNRYDKRTNALRQELFNHLVAHCEFNKITKTEIANKLGVTLQRVYAAFEKMPSVEYLIEMCSAAGLQVHVVVHKDKYKY